MKKTILNLEGVEVLSKIEMKNVNGKGYVTDHQCTGRFYSSVEGTGEGPVAYECTARYQRTFLGMDWGKPQELESGQVFPCPEGMIC